jgi:arylsulfatase A-like enzyme
MKVLVLTVSGLHLNYLGAYGNDWVATPALDRLAAEGIVFDQHYADCPESAGARRSWWSGRYTFSPMPERGESGESSALVELLRAQGITTCLVAGAATLRSGAPGGWDHVEIPPLTEEGTALERSLEAIANALDRLDGVEHWLLWAELADLFPPWEVPDEFLQRYFPQPEPDPEQPEEEPPLPLIAPQLGPIDPSDVLTLERLQKTYAAGVTYLDAGLGLLREELETRGLLDALDLYITADRGLPLGEHGILGDQRPWLHDELIHVPLLVRLAGAAEAGRRIAALTQAVDLLPTLLHTLGIPSPPALHGHNLLALMRGEVEQVRRYASSSLRKGDAAEWALRTPEWGFLLPLASESAAEPRGVQLYVKPDDRWEVNNVLQHHLELAEHLEQTLRGFAEATDRPGPLTPPELRDIAAEAKSNS